MNMKLGISDSCQVCIIMHKKKACKAILVPRRRKKTPRCGARTYGLRMYKRLTAKEAWRYARMEGLLSQEMPSQPLVIGRIPAYISSQGGVSLNSLKEREIFG